MTIAERLAIVTKAVEALDYADAFEHARLLTGALKVLNRTVNPAEVNYVGVPDEIVRRVVEPPFTALAHALDVAYYQHWRHGRSRDWHGYDVQATPEASKAQFDMLSGLIWHELAIALDDADQLQDPEDRIPAKRKIGDVDGRTTRQVAEDWMAARGLALPASARPRKVTRADLVPVRDQVRARRALR